MIEYIDLKTIIFNVQSIWRDAAIYNQLLLFKHTFLTMLFVRVFNINLICTHPPHPCTHTPHPYTHSLHLCTHSCTHSPHPCTHPPHPYTHPPHLYTHPLKQQLTKSTSGGGGVRFSLINHLINELNAPRAV